MLLRFGCPHSRPSHHGRLLRLHLSRADLGSWYPDLLTVTALVPSSSLWAFNDPRILTWVTVVAEIFVLIIVVVCTSVLLCNKSFVNSDRRRKLPEISDRDTEREENEKKIPAQLAFTGGQFCGTSARRSAAKMGWFWALALRANSLAGPVVMLIYPLYASIMAIESPYKEDDQLWLTYWVLYSFVTLLELVAAPVFRWIPLWSTIKLLVASWLVLPEFRGGIIIYEHFVKPYSSGTVQNGDAKLTDSQNANAKLTDSQRKILASISPETRSSVAQYIDENGSDAFDKFMAAAVAESRKNRESS